MTVRTSTAFGALVVLALTACADDRVGPTPVSTPAAEPADGAGDSLLQAPQTALLLDNRSSLPGIVHGTWTMESSYLNSVHTGWVQGGPLDPSNILSKLSGARSKGGRVVIKLSKGKDSYIKNSDGTFSLTKWKSLVGAYKGVNFASYLSDGTIVGHLLIDEPHRAGRWGGKAISQATVEEMAKFSKQLWPGMPTLVRDVPSWLASASVTYANLDAGWTQYASGKGNPGSWVTAEAAAARKKGLGLVVGMNVLDGGDGSSRIAGYTRGKYAMSAAEIRTYGYAMLAEGYACAFYNWSHDSDYYGRSDIKSAMADVAAKAKAHAKTACRQ
jgi:hypothetical protein